MFQHSLNGQDGDGFLGFAQVAICLADCILNTLQVVGLLLQPHIELVHRWLQNVPHGCCQDGSDILDDGDVVQELKNINGHL